MTPQPETLERIAAALERIAATLERQQATTFATTPEGLPICPRHGEVMKLREKQGDTWHSHRVIDPATGEELYCRGYPSKSSPGWDVVTQPSPPAAKPVTTTRPPQTSELDGYFPR